jgi:hypothetical protein
MIRVSVDRRPRFLQQFKEGVMGANSAPSHNVYTVEDRGENEDPFWLKIGAAWPHKDGKGFNITLSALPPDARLVLRVPSEPDDDDKPSGSSRRGKR